MAAPALRESGRTVNWPRMRPRFEVEVDCSVEDVMEALRAGVERGAGPIQGRFSERHCVLTVPESERQFWSTQLGITVERRGSEEEGGDRAARVLGVFSPHPELWTGYVFTIGTLLGIVVFGVMVAIVQASMGWMPWALIVSLVALLLGGLVYTSTLVGQGLAAGEMYQLRSHLEDALEVAVTRSKAALAASVGRGGL